MEIHYHGLSGWDGIIEYIFQDTQYVYMLGYESTQGEPYSFVYSPYRVLGARAMQPGNKYINFVEQTPGGGVIFRQHEFLGIEDVVVPAGSFPGCLKMLQRRENGIYRLSYLAPGVGLVKHLGAGGGSGYKWELAAANIGGTSYPAGSVICRASGTIDIGQPVDTLFEFYFATPSLPVKTSLKITKLTEGVSLDPIPIISQDGVTFLTESTYYTEEWGDFPEGVNVSLTIDGGSVSGYLTVSPDSNSSQHDMGGTVTCN